MLRRECFKFGFGSGFALALGWDTFWMDTWVRGVKRQTAAGWRMVVETEGSEWDTFGGAVGVIAQEELGKEPLSSRRWFK